MAKPLLRCEVGLYFRPYNSIFHLKGFMTFAQVCALRGLEILTVVCLFSNAQLRPQLI